MKLERKVKYDSSNKINFNMSVIRTVLGYELRSRIMNFNRCSCKYFI